MFKKLIAGADQRKTRLHDELGNRIPFGRMVRHLPFAVSTGLARIAFGHRSVRPWISYDAQRLIATMLDRRSRVLEFGSGMSTAWYARHAGHVVSIEDYRPWYDKVDTILKRIGMSNIDYLYAENQKEYIKKAYEFRREGFDFIMIDGSYRDACMAAAPDFICPGGSIYLDNSDKSSDPATGDVPKARTYLLQLAERRSAKTTFFTDFAPTQLFVQQGIMVQMPNDAAGG